jgi:Uma2 family endonuclease
LSISWPDHLLTLDEWDALPEDVSRRFELVEGVLQMSPRPTSNHQLIAAMLSAQLNPQLLRSGLVAIPEVDVVLVEGFPPTLRAPDLAVVSLADARKAPVRYRADQVAVAVEIVSPGSARIDRVAKLADYADAAIAHYWILGSEAPITMDAFVLEGSTYRSVRQAATGTVQLDEPVPLSLDLGALLP